MIHMKYQALFFSNKELLQNMLSTAVMIGAFSKKLFQEHLSGFQTVQI